MATLPPLPPRRADAHKGDFGRVCLIGGSVGMVGAPALAALSALRSGAGLVQVACPAEIRTAVTGLVPCATTCLLKNYQEFKPTVRAVGPGCGDQLRTEDLTRLMEDQTSPMVIDADGLNVLSTIDQWWKLTRNDHVLTPHSGEMRRLLERTSIDPAGERTEITQNLSRLCRAVVVLKGMNTVVACGSDVFVNDTGNPGMATAGSGDVLTGVIAALIGQGLDCYGAACLGVHLHGLAGDIAAEDKGEIPLIATDLIEALPQAFHTHQRDAG